MPLSKVIKPSFAEIASVPYRQHPRYRGVVGHWIMADGGGNIVRDISYGNDGTLTNMDPATDWVTGQFGKVLDFDGADDDVDIGAPTLLDDLGPLTMSAWINPRTAGEGSTGKIFSKRPTGAVTSDWFLEIDNTTPEVNAFEFIKDETPNIGRVTNDNTVSFNVWQHIVVTWDGTNQGTGVHIYKNGIELGYQATTGGGTNGSDATYPIHIGNQDDGAATFDGQIDDVRLYNRVLTAAEVWSLYTGPFLEFRQPRVRVRRGAQINTRARRFSMMNFGDGTTIHVLFEADGAVDLDDRQHLLDCYSGIAFGPPVGVATTKLLQIMGANMRGGHRRDAGGFVT